jgi:hypothetical protein
MLPRMVSYVNELLYVFSLISSPTSFLILEILFVVGGQNSLFFSSLPSICREYRIEKEFL